MPNSTILTPGSRTASAALLPQAKIVPDLPAGQPVSDLRCGQFGWPTGFAGYDPKTDATCLALNYVTPATSPVPGTLATGSYANNERYIIKVPNAWNGSLMVAGTPALRSEYANEEIWGDFALANGYAFASSNKAILYNAILEPLSASPNPNRAYPIPFDYVVPGSAPPLKLETEKFTARAGVLNQPGTVADWNEDYVTLVRATQDFLEKFFGKRPARTYAVGASNGGAQVRWLLENHASLVDGGVDWEGVYWSRSLNFLMYLPKFLAAMPAYVASGFQDKDAAAAIMAAGYPPDIPGNSGHPSLWFEYYANEPSFYVDDSLFTYALLLDPQATSSLSPGGCTPNPTNPAGLPGTCDGTGLAVPENRASYVPSDEVGAVIERFEHTGNIGKPLISIAGSADILVAPQLNAKPYLEAVWRCGKQKHYWQYLVEGGTHLDTFANADWGYGLRPQLPFAWAAFIQLVEVVERGFVPPNPGHQQLVSHPCQIL